MNDIAPITAEVREEISVRLATEADIPALGHMNREGFSGNKPEGSGEDWMRTYLESKKCRMWVLEITSPRVELAGYIVWEIKGGWNRQYTTTELEQLEIAANHRGKGFSDALIEGTIEHLGPWIREKNVVSGYEGQIIVWVDGGNVPALKTYARRFPQSGGHRCEYLRNGSRLEEAMLKGTIPIPLLKK